MVGTAATAAVPAELEHAREQLWRVAARVSDAQRAALRHEASGWDGLAAAAYQRALDQLGRELEEAVELMHAAIDLLGAALFELDGHA